MTTLRHVKPKNRVSIPLWAKDLYLLQRVQTECGVHPASYSMVHDDISRMVKRLGREANHWPTYIDQLDHVWGFTHTCPYTLMPCRANTSVWVERSKVTHTKKKKKKRKEKKLTDSEFTIYGSATKVRVFRPLAQDFQDFEPVAYCHQKLLEC